MKRDMDLVRKILLRMEDESNGHFDGRIYLEGYTADQIGFHVYLMIEAGLIEGVDATTYDSQGPEAIPSRITWFGYDFLDACRDEGRWKKAKEIFDRAGGVTFDMAKEILLSLMVKGVGQALNVG